jgi:hypothetical protein
MIVRGQQHSTALANFQLNEQDCPKDLAIYVPRTWAEEPEAIEQYERVKGSYQFALNSLGQNIPPMPIVLYSWDSGRIPNSDISYVSLRFIKTVSVRLYYRLPQILTTRLWIECCQLTMC